MVKRQPSGPQVAGDIRGVALLVGGGRVDDWNVEYR